MKNLRLGISALALTIASAVSAQTTSNPWLIGVGAHGVNHKAAYNGVPGFFDNLTDKPLWTMNNYSITPPLSKLTVARNLNKYLVLDWQTSVGNVGNKRFAMDKEFFLMTGLGLQFKFNGLWNEESWFDPYLRVGANYLRHDYSGLSFPRTDVMGHAYPAYDGDGDLVGKANHFTASGGLGSNFWITKNFGLGVQGDYVTTPFNNSDVANFWQASASILFRFGAKPAPAPIPEPEPAPAPAPEPEPAPAPAPAPEPAPAPKTEEVVTTVLRDILFNFNKATLRPESASKLDEAAKIIKEAPAQNFLIVGMTDKKGSDAYNLKLSRERAAAVVKGLEERGVNPSSLKSIGIGSQEAVVPVTASDAERMRDRKVVVRAISGSEWESYKKNDITVAVPVIKKATGKKATAGKHHAAPAKKVAAKKAPVKKAPAKKAPAKKK